MNCECVYSIKNGTEKDFDEFAEKVRKMRCELYPVTFAIVTKDVQCTKDYDGYGQAFILKKGTPIIFIDGKYCFMKDMDRAKVLFPRERNTSWFRDLKEY